MSDFLRSTAAIAFVFGLVIFIHELGHFLAAKAFRVYAPRFSIGFGKRLWSRKWGETEYILAAFPLGGYVRMASRDDESMAFIEGGGEHAVEVAAAQRPRFWTPDGMAPFGPRPVPADRWFESKPRLARLVILLAGVTMNIVLGFVIFTGLAVAFGGTVLNTRVVGAVDTVATIPQLQRLAPGDTIFSVNGVPTSNWYAIGDVIDSAVADTLVFATQRGSVSVPAGPASGPGRSMIGAALGPMVPAVVDQVVAKTPADKAGLRAGDSVVAIDGSPVLVWRDFVRHVEPAAGRELHLSVIRKGERLTFTVRPDSLRAYDPETGEQRVIGKIGAGVRNPIAREPIPFSRALRAGALNTWGSAQVVVTSLRLLFTGQVSIRELGGPLAIGSETVHAARRGWESLLILLAMISINIAIINLLPIPVLDGGQILLLGAEAVKGSALSLRTREYLMRAGIAMILLLLIVVMVNDIPKIFREITRP